MQIKKIEENKKQFLDLLLLADEQEDMIDRYLDRGDMYILCDPDPKSVCVVTREGQGIYELKNIATYEQEQGKGYGSSLIEFLFIRYGEDGNVMLVGTGDSPLTIPFYKRCGFEISHRVKDFFTDHYDHPIYEGGVLLTDMVYLRREFPRMRREPETKRQ